MGLATSLVRSASAGRAIALCALALGLLVGGCNRGSVGSEPVSKCVPEGACDQSMFVAGVRAELGSVDKGQVLFSSTCASCHGTDGKGLVPQGTQRVDFTSQLWHAKLKDSEIAKIILNGIPPKMPPLNLEEAQLRDVIAYLRSLKLERETNREPPGY